MGNDKLLNQLFKSHSSLLKIKVDSSFAKTLKKIFRSKNADFVYLQKPNALQMSAVLFARLSGKKFFWIQGFSNPPKPSLFTRLLLNQADTILVKSKKAAAEVRSQGVDKPKIKVVSD